MREFLTKKKCSYLRLVRFTVQTNVSVLLLELQFSIGCDAIVENTADTERIDVTVATVPIDRFFVILFW